MLTHDAPTMMNQSVATQTVPQTDHTQRYPIMRAFLMSQGVAVSQPPHPLPKADKAAASHPAPDLKNAGKRSRTGCKRPAAAAKTTAAKKRAKAKSPGPSLD